MAGDDTSLTTPARVSLPTAAGGEVTRLAAAAADYAEGSKSPATRRAYNSAWRMFAAWCDAHQAQALPAHPGVVALYLTDRAGAGARVATLTKTIAAIADHHRRGGFAPPSSPGLTEIWSGIRRAHARRPGRKSALAVADLRRVCSRLPASPAGVRDRALLTLQFAAALRRSELVALVLGDGGGESAQHPCFFVTGGLLIRLGATKSDQEARGVDIAVPAGKTKLCPVVALRAWLELSGIKKGFIFRGIDRHGRVAPTGLSGQAVADIVKRAVGRVGLNPDLFSGHSPRVGMVTSAAAAGVGIELIMRQSRHAKPETALMYIREAELFSRNAAGKVGL